MPKTITQRVVFRNALASELYAMYLDPRGHAAITGKPARISAQEGTSYSANGGGHRGMILQLIKDKLIVQSFHAADWGLRDTDSTLILLFEQAGADAVITMTHVNIPDDQAEAVRQGWKNYYWSPWKKHLAVVRRACEAVEKVAA